jgi:hypothetical protein
MIEGTHLEHWINNITLGTFLSGGYDDDGTKKKRRSSKVSIVEPGGVIDKSNLPKTKKKKKMEMPF